MKIISLKDSNLDQIISLAITTLTQGGLVIYPTETVCGIGADATNQAAVDRLLEYKSRREGKPLSIAVANQAMAEQFVELNEQARQLYQRFLPGPYTIISKYTGGLAQGVASEFGSVGVRLPDYPLIQQLVESFGKPITATSANASGKKRPYQVSDVLDHLSKKQRGLIGLIIDAGRLPPNEPSVVIDTTHSTPIALRGQYLGGISSAAQNSSQKLVKLASHSDQETQTIAGKLLLKHWERLKSKGLVIGLDGELGAGKTVFAKGLAQFLGISEEIVSPTYTYIKEYNFTRNEVRGMFYHLDAWKVEEKEMLESFQLERLLQAHHLIAIEWWSQVAGMLPSTIKPNIIVKIEADQKQTECELGDNIRQLTIIEHE